MNKQIGLCLDQIHRVYARLTKAEFIPQEARGLTDVSDISRQVSSLLESPNPRMIARFGSTELDCMSMVLGVTNRFVGQKKSLISYFRSEEPEWWWNQRRLKNMKDLSGFFPNTPENAIRFTDLMLEDCSMLDMLGSWRTNEKYFQPYMSQNMVRVDREKLNPFFAERPWTLSLRGKRVLVVHPFVETIRQQYAHREKLFPREILPDFELLLLPAVQSLGGQNNRFKDWFEALQWMKNQMDKIDYDVVLLGCGAYGFPLAAHAKRTGHKAVHIGGSLQLFFGIKGRRWESAGYKGTDHDYSTLFNEYWVRPSKDEKPKAANQVENGCYW